VIEVLDYEMDGQADVRMQYGSPAHVEIWHGNQWLPVERRGDARGVYLEGQFKSVLSKDGRLYVEAP
jgi:hypothetical protein